MSGVGRRSHRAMACLAAEEEGSAIVEFCYLAILMLVPLAYVMVAVLDVQSASFAVTGAAREAGRSLNRLPEGADPRLAAYRAARIATGDFGVELASTDLVCRPDPTCRVRPGDSVEITVHADVGLPFLPRLARDSDRLSVPVTSTYLARTGRFAAPATR